MFATVVALALLLLPIRAQSNEQDIAARLRHKALFLRGMWADDKLAFDVSGQPTQTFRVTSFTLSGIDIAVVKLTPGKLHLEGERVGLQIDPKGSITRMPVGERIKVDIDGATDEYTTVLDAIFAPDIASLAPSLPTYWQRYARIHFLPRAAAGVDNVAGSNLSSASASSSQPEGQSTKTIHHDVKAPKLLQGADPGITPTARALKYSGVVEVYCWVNEDGSTSHLQVIRPIGLGLDENAVAAVAKYKFGPAIENGKPVKVDLYTNVSFVEN